MQFIEEFRTPGHVEIDPVRFARITGVDPIELAKAGCTGGKEAEGFTHSRLQNLLRDSLRGLSAAYSITQDRKSAIDWFCSGTVPEFENRAVKELIVNGKIDAVLMYLSSIGSGSSG